MPHVPQTLAEFFNTFHFTALYIPFSFISLCFVYSFALIQFARTCESVRKRQQTTLAIRDALIAIALLSFHANFPNMFAMRMGEWEGERGRSRRRKRSERIFAILLLFRFTFHGLAGKFWLRSCDPNTFNTITIWNITDNDAPPLLPLLSMIYLLAARLGTRPPTIDRR